MAEKINKGLFVRLMRDPAPARKDILEFIGTGPVAADELLSECIARTHTARAVPPVPANDVTTPVTPWVAPR